MNRIVIQLTQDLKEISNKTFLKTLLIRQKILISKNKIKKYLLNKSYYNALDIIEFVQLLKMSEMLGYIHCDDALSYHCANNINSANVNSGLLTYTTDSLDGRKIQIIFKAKLNSDMDRIGYIDIEWITIENTHEAIDSKYISGHSLAYSKSIKSLNKNDTKNPSDILESSYEILHNIFLIYIEEIFDGIERKYLYEN